MKATEKDLGAHAGLRKLPENLRRRAPVYYVVGTLRAFPDPQQRPYVDAPRS